MCKRQIINAGIDKVVVRTGPETFIVTDVEEWINNDDSLCQC